MSFVTLFSSKNKLTQFTIKKKKKRERERKRKDLGDTSKL
jgi:hypothetical protein